MNKFKLKHLTLAVAMMAVAGVASAAGDTQTVQVIGRLTPGSCELSLDNGGIFNYGNINLETLSPTDANALGVRQTPIHIDCSGPIKVGVRTRDNMLSTADGSDGVQAAAQNSLGVGNVGGGRLFGLGAASDGTNIGVYIMTIPRANTLIDGVQPGSLMYSDTNGASYAESGGGAGYMSNTDTRFFTWGETTGVPGAFTTMSGVLTVAPAVKPTDNLPSGQAEDLSGNSTIELVYL